MASNPLTKVARQHKSIWTSPSKTCVGHAQQPFKPFPEDVLPFFENKAISVGSSIAHLALSLLTTTAFILVNNDATVKTDSIQFNSIQAIFNQEAYVTIMCFSVGSCYPTSSPCLSAIQELANQLRWITLRLHLLWLSPNQVRLCL